MVTEDQVLKIPAGLPVDAAATVSVNPCTAFRMLKDFEELGPGNYKIHWLRWLQYFKKARILSDLTGPFLFDICEAWQ